MSIARRASKRGRSASSVGGDRATGITTRCHDRILGTHRLRVGLVSAAANGVA
jgi:hypothetical protein